MTGPGAAGLMRSGAGTARAKCPSRVRPALRSAPARPARTLVPARVSAGRAFSRDLRPHYGDQCVGTETAAGDARPEGRADHQHFLSGRALSEHADGGGLQRDQACRDRVERVDQCRRVQERHPRDLGAAGRGGDADSGEAPGAAGQGGSRKNAAGGGSRSDHPLSRQSAAAHAWRRSSSARAGTTSTLAAWKRPKLSMRTASFFNRNLLRRLLLGTCLLFAVLRPAPTSSTSTTPSWRSWPLPGFL